VAPEMESPGYRKPASRPLHCGSGKEVSEKGVHISETCDGMVSMMSFDSVP
jgi:hypothetical protein